MSFLDNLENNLKAMESREEKDPEAVREQQAAREAAKAAALSVAPNAEALKRSPFTGDLLAACRVAGHAKRVMVRATWLGNVFRLEAGERRLELRPTVAGVEAAFALGGVESSVEPIDLTGDARKLAERWLS